MHTIAVELITLGGLVSDPDGSPGVPPGSRMSGHGGKAVGTEERLRVGPAVLTRYRRAVR